MSTLRVLLIETDEEEAVRISTALAQADHFVLATPGFEEASEALSIQKWDAVLLPTSEWSESLAQFAAQLREKEGSTKYGSRTPLVSVGHSDSSFDGKGFDLVLSQPFEAERFAETVRSCSAASHPSPSGVDDAAHLPVFDPEAFAEQVGFDRDLTVEIIDLFLQERTEQLAQMVEALVADDLAQLSRAAHTIKGSFGSLHAPRARCHAHELEMAAKEGDRNACLRLLPTVEQDLEDLVPELLQLRN